MENTEAKENLQEETTASEEIIEETAEETVEKSPEELLKEEVEQLKDKMMRHAAEFDNFKKRTAKEREDLYSMAVCDTVEKILPVKDGLFFCFYSSGFAAFFFRRCSSCFLRQNASTFSLYTVPKIPNRPVTAKTMRAASPSP